ncbi:hypothetical protein BDZ97DRAFT_799283 [Flammula alnicola]|nr:hypothetical protein BDZ97DRAFT_799283 [Flammula alnicola]
MAEAELVLDAVDLQLTISEDNIYAREVSLHDLNVLHDVSGINGLLRMRLYASAPRFITRYQHLQDEVSRLNLEPPVGEVGEFSTEVDVEGEPSHEENPDLPVPQIDYEADQNVHEGEDQGAEPASDVQKLAHEPEVDDEQVSSKDLEVAFDDSISHHPLSTEEDQEQENNQEDDGTNNSVPDPSNEHTKDSHDDKESQTPSHHSTPSSSPSREIDQPSRDNTDSDVIALEALETGLNDDASYPEGEDSQYPNREELEFPDYEEEEHAKLEDVDQQQQEQGVEEKNELPETTAEESETFDSSIVPGTGHETTDEQDSVVYHDANYDVELEGDHVNYKTGDPARDKAEPFESNIDPVEYEETWEDDLDGEGDPDTTWDDNEIENAQSNSTNSSITLSSKASKRSYDEFESGGEGYEDEDSRHWTPPSSPGPKRSRIQ